MRLYRQLAAVLLLASRASAQGVWERRADFPVDASGVSVATVFGRRLYTVCGATARGTINSLYIYDPAVDQWSSGPPAPIEGGAQDCNTGATAGKLYVLGAVRPGGAVDGNTYVYDATENEWRMAGAMPTPRAASGVAVIGTRIYVAGGIDASGRASAAFEVFETETRVWTRLPDLPAARSHLTAKAIRGMVYAIGGRAEGPLATVEEFNPATSVWRSRAAMPTARFRLGSGRSGNRIQVFGGEGACGGVGVCVQTEEYDPAANAWRTLAPLPTARAGVSGATLDGRVFTVGGGRSAPGYSNATEALHLPPARPPVIAADGVVNSASLLPGLAPGALATLFGAQLSQGSQQGLRPQPPTEMNAVTVKLNGRAVPLLYVDPEQINFQAPADFPVGPVEVAVTHAGVESAKVSLPPVAQYAPAIFTFTGTGTGQGIVLIAGTGLIASGRRSTGFRPARRGEAVEIYCTGLGSPAAVPVVTIGGADAEVLSSDAVTGLPGVYRVSVRIPASSATGAAVAVTLRVGGVSTPAAARVTIGVQ